MLEVLDHPASELVAWQTPSLRPAWFRPYAGFRPKVSLDIDAGAYRIKTAADSDELKMALALRKQIFHYEFSKKLFSFRSDLDQFDHPGDHLIIIDNESGECVGVYRLLCSRFTDKFYAATEFHIDQLLDLPGVKLELSRACILKEHRNGQVLNLLWRGIAAYAQRTGADYLFGLSSVLTTDLKTITRINRYLESKGLTDLGCDIIPNADFRIDSFDQHVARFCKMADEDDDTEIEDQIPPLFQLYLKAGAKVCSHPVIDTKMHCADWLTVLNFKELSPAFARRFVRR